MLAETFKINRKKDYFFSASIPCDVAGKRSKKLSVTELNHLAGNRSNSLEMKSNLLGWLTSRKNAIDV